ncbi:MAG TPA: hypothetical protein VGL20_14990 [Candidatus Dormibacteraeota bacterium]
MKTYPLRLDERQAAELQIVAEVEGLTVADEIRAAIAAHLDARRADPEFQRRLRVCMERDLEVYERLGGRSRDGALPARIAEADERH